MKTIVSKNVAVTGVDERLYRAEYRKQSSCIEVGIRGPFNGSIFKADGSTPKWAVGYRTAFKVVGNKAMKTDSIRSKKHKSEMDLDWVHFARELGYEVVVE
jgi:hypothetical protein